MLDNAIIASGLAVSRHMISCFFLSSSVGCAQFPRIYLFLCLLMLLSCHTHGTRVGGCVYMPERLITGCPCAGVVQVHREMRTHENPKYDGLLLSFFSFASTEQVIVVFAIAFKHDLSIDLDCRKYQKSGPKLIYLTALLADYWANIN
ncbi:hypothetical protein BKA67DRAFT_11376 [Truncatella angustata]|uniref:Uncharacterized protein n=1 Tax=Truncatella angustata TaxID=152316 RepID=A0A9P8UUF9_9PEZI|nr:uncharacterized protein BKA67DRAFT_11376 [Truncatella angustata]KAH6659349.1 hypothetical protein BKA67DRAFT_11376 [Truncatella angustata]